MVVLPSEMPLGSPQIMAVGVANRLVRLLLCAIFMVERRLYSLGCRAR